MITFYGRTTEKRNTILSLECRVKRLRCHRVKWAHLDDFTVTKNTVIVKTLLRRGGKVRRGTQCFLNEKRKEVVVRKWNWTENNREIKFVTQIQERLMLYILHYKSERKGDNCFSDNSTIWILLNQMKTFCCFFVPPADVVRYRFPHCSSLSTNKYNCNCNVNVSLFKYVHNEAAVSRRWFLVQPAKFKWQHYWVDRISFHMQRCMIALGADLRTKRER